MLSSSMLRTCYLLVFATLLSCSRVHATDAEALSRKKGPKNGNYKEVLGLSFQFYDAQRSGKLPSSNRIPWRGDTFTSDCDGVMSGGFFDAGDHLKLLFPLSNSLAFLGLATSEFKQGMEAAGQLKYAQDTLRWGADFLMKAHIAPNKFIGQVGDPGSDHAYWGRPEQQSGPRPCYTWDMSSQPASDLASAAASALAAASLVFRSTDPRYADKALKHAKELYAAAAAKEGKYSDNYSSVTYVYNSFTYRDDLAFAATMLWKATGDASYLAEAKNHRSKSDFSVESYVNWDAVGPLSAILLKCGGEETSESAAHVSKFLSDWQNCNGNGYSKTPKGLCIAPLGGWGNLRHATSAAFGALLYANCENDSSKRSDAIKFAKSQVDYALGSSGRSFVVGYGTNPPVRPHHRAASCPSPTSSTCDWNNYNSDGPNPQVIKGALVGGPGGPGDEYIDSRQDYRSNEVAVDFNAGFTGALAGLLKLQ
ncbi:hypothetical protein Ndes2526B_g06009 [Nannochloris sp. 'desiccata']